jgi:hypothetical protein
LKIEKITIRSKDYDEGHIGPRSLTIRTDKHTIETPTRTLISSEARYHAQTALSFDPLENEVFEYVRNYKPANIAGLTTRNGPMAEETAKLRSLGDRYSGMVRLVYPRLNQIASLDLDEARAIVDAALLSDYDMVPIPDMGPGDEGKLRPEYEKSIARLRNYVEEKGGRVAVPYVDMANDPEVFRSKIALLLETGFNVVGLVYRNPERNYPNFTHINSLSDREVWFHASGVGRYWKKIASQPHLPQMFGIDTVGLDAPLGGGNGDAAPKPPETVRRYDSRELGLWNKDQANERHGNNLGCSCPICTGLDLDTFYKTYQKRPQGKIVNPEYLRQVACVHEVYASHAEFEHSRQWVKKKEFGEYLGGKAAFEGTLDDLGN